MNEDKLKTLNHLLAITVILPSLIIFFVNENIKYWLWDWNCHQVGCPKQIYSLGTEMVLMTIVLMVTEIALISIFVSNRRKEK